MKLMFASDIHGSAYYCEKMLEAFKNEKAERLILLGDILYHGPRNDLPKGYDPKAVIKMLNENKADLICIRGNCDCDVDQMVLEFPIMAENMIIYAGERMCWLSHGHVINPQNNMLKKGDILINGHTHVPALDMSGDVGYLNPGSVSIPKNGSKNGYMIFENNEFVLKSLDGEVVDRVKLS